MIGTRFSRLIVVSAAEPVSRPSGGKPRLRWLCLCDCGVEKIVRQEYLKSGNTRSCGCLYRESRHTARLTHGQTKTPLHRVWMTMKERCHNPNNHKYPDYGGRGITVCPAWRESFEAFLADMGERPSTGHSIERINNDGNYEPSNCRWATPDEQSANRRNNIWVEWQGRRMILRDAIATAGLPRKSVERRLKRGWTLERALTTPLPGHPQQSPKSLINVRLGHL